LESELAEQQAVNADLQARNRLLEIEVVDLKNGLEAVEERRTLGTRDDWRR
jgi:cell division protein FtsB